jgi:phage terminase large subunit
MNDVINIEIRREVFNDVYIPHLENMARTQIFYGGSGSGKSVFLAQRAVFDVLGGGRNYLICRQVGRYVRRSVYTEVKKVIVEWNLEELFDMNMSAGIITCKENGYQLLFTGLDDPEKIKSITPEKGVITDIWVEEATETNVNTIKQLYKRQRAGRSDRPKRLTLSFNPILKTHPIYDEFFKSLGWADDQTEFISDDLTILKTWYIHNKFLTEDDIADLENETDDYFYQVYTLGNWGVLGNVIFKNWEVRDLSDMHPQYVNIRNGLDFGYSNDPAAAVSLHYDKMRKTIYIYWEMYATELTNDLLAAELKPAIGRDLLVCDSAEPKSIQELKDHGINAVGAKKGKDSVNHGVQWLQQQTMTSPV